MRSMGNAPDYLRWTAVAVGFFGVVGGWYAGEGLFDDGVFGSLISFVAGTFVVLVIEYRRSTIAD